MFFNCKLSVVIGDKELKTVSSVSVKNDGQQIGSECEVVVPLNCRIQYANGKKDFLTDYVKNLFAVGDKIVVQAWYEGYNKITVFEGFLVEFMEGNPITIKCLDYIYNLNMKSLDFSYKSISIKELVTKCLDGTGVTLQLPTIELNLQNISFRLSTAAAVLDYLKSIGINIKLFGASLYMNLASNTLDTVVYRTDRNVLKSDLQKPSAVFAKYKLKAWFIREDGTKDSYEVGDADGQLHEVFFYRIKRDAGIYKNMANEALKRHKQHRYKGGIETLLYPECGLYWQASYTDIRYPDRSANYVITGMDITLSESGFHRHLKLAYLSDL